MESDFDHFPELRPGQLLIWEAALTHLEEHIEHLIHRAKYYGETPVSRAFIDEMEFLQKKAQQIRKTSEG